MFATVHFDRTGDGLVLIDTMITVDSFMLIAVVQSNSVGSGNTTVGRLRIKYDGYLGGCHVCFGDVNPWVAVYYINLEKT